MSVRDLDVGDVVYAKVALYNDEEEGVPELEPGVLIAESGTRGVIVNVGHLEESPDTLLFLVRFEQKAQDNVLGPPVGCWEEELSMESLG